MLGGLEQCARGLGGLRFDGSIDARRHRARPRDHALKASPDRSADDGDSGITAAIVRGVLFPRLRGKTASVGDI